MLFISHKDEDTDVAIALCKHITEDFGFNIYSNVYDNEFRKRIKTMIQRVLLTQSIREYSMPHICYVSWQKNQRILGGFPMGFAQAKGVKTSLIEDKPFRNFIDSKNRVVVEFSAFMRD